MLLKFASVLRPLFGLIFLSGCFRVGLPEYVSGASAVETGIGVYPAQARLMKRYDARRPFALLVGSADASAEPAETRNHSLGHQYLLGIIPFTRVFYEHGAQQLAEETTAQLLSERGYRVLRVSSAHFPLFAPEVPIALAVRARFEKLRINAYDALFFRLADVSGELSVEFYSPHSLEPLTSVRKIIDESEYRKQAQAPTLAALAERAVRTAVDESFAKAPGARESRLLARTDSRARVTEPPLWLLSPAFTAPPPPALGSYLAASYGFDSVAPFRTTAVLRIAQRGIEEELEARGVPVLSALTAIDESLPLRALRPEVTNLTFNDSGAAVLELRLTELLSGMPSRSGRCSVQESAASGVDGAAVVTLERALRTAVAAFYGDGRPGAECRSGI